MDKENINFLWEIYLDLVTQKEKEAGEDYPSYNIDDIIKKISGKITLELKNLK